MHYLVDGYNLLYALPDIPPGDGQAKREALLRYLARTQLQGANPITVVFDSHEGLGDSMRQAEINVVFTAGHSADDWLADKVRAVQNPRNYVVVSNDKGIREQIRGTGAKWMSADEFLKRAEKTPDTKPPRDTSARDSITDELRKTWLDPGPND